MTPAAAVLDRLLDIVVTTELDQPGRISVGPAVLALAISKLPAAERDDACDGSPLMDVTRARDGWIWTCRHMPHHMALELR